MSYLSKLAIDWNRYVRCSTCPFEPECHDLPYFEVSCAEFVIGLIKEEMKSDPTL